MRKFPIFLFLLSFLFFIGAADVSSPVPPTKSLFVNDSSNYIFRDHRNFILKNSQILYEKSGVQLIALAVKDCSGLDASETSAQVLAGWHFTGDVGENAVLILLSASDKRLHIETSGDAAEKLGMAEISRAYELSKPYLDDSIYSKTMLESYKSVLKDLYAAYGLDPGGELLGELAPGTEKGQNEPLYASLVFIVMAVFIGLRGLLISRKYQKKYLNRKYYKRRRFISEPSPYDEDDENDIIEYRTDPHK